MRNIFLCAVPCGNFFFSRVALNREILGDALFLGGELVLAGGSL